ncbi:hypothetical protein GCM10007971_35850 [Oceanobacillus indicireducens]|uniref:Uncharacterized protein n=1 Tax=Oceanobacillus indicireducens TaxID=1004261 RepID=A0A917Y5N4_9BACI|nr:hypothetical protein GCM10007971_35850 [Oceanobacillus indicireducens]
MELTNVHTFSIGKFNRVQCDPLGMISFSFNQFGILLLHMRVNILVYVICTYVQKFSLYSCMFVELVKSYYNLKFR